VQVFLCSNPSAQGPHITIKKRNIYIYIYIAKQTIENHYNENRTYERKNSYFAGLMHFSFAQGFVSSLVEI
jgi:hypothetical protein